MFYFPNTNLHPIASPYLALLCDLDGTLADTEPQHCSAWINMLAEDFGFQYDVPWFDQFIGTSDRVVAEFVVRERALDLPPNDLMSRKQQRFHTEVRAAARSFPGVAAELATVSAAYPLAIATNSGRADANVIVPALGLDRYTKVIVTATDVENLKPAPDIYLLAAERLGVPASRCIAIEDSAPGGESASAAGCYLIGLNERVTVADEQIQDNAAALRRALELLGGA